MSKVTLTDLVNLQNETAAVTAINDNNQKLETALDVTLSRDGTSPNQMVANLDMNSNHILNLPTPTSNYDPIRLIDVNTLNGSGITVSTLPAGGTVGQVLTKTSSTNYATNWVSPAVTVVTPEEFGYTTYDSGDAGTAIQSAIDSVAGPVTVNLGPHAYRVVTPIVVTKFSVLITGVGDATNVKFAPAFNNQVLFKWHDSLSTTGVYYGGLTNMRITSEDVVFTKTAVNLIDVGDLDISNLVIGNLWTNGSDCIGLQTNGRQTLNFDNLRIFADKPIVIKSNPNPSISTDHFNFTNIYLLAGNTNPCITVDQDVFISNLTFDGFQAWVGGTYGFYYNETSSGGRGYNLAFSNVRREGTTLSSSYSFYINVTNRLASVSINNCSWDTGSKGLYARGCLNLSLRDIYFPAIASTEAINIDTTDLSVVIDNCRWESGATQNIGALTTKYSYNVAGASATVPSNALYSI